MNAPESSSVLAIVLNWNNGADSRRCVTSVLASEGAAVEARIVDNGSADGSPDSLAEEFGEHRLIRLPDNRGYTGGMNAGLSYWLESSDAPYALVLTDDVILEPDAIRRLVRLLEDDAGLAVVGPVIHHRDRPQEVFAAGGVLEPRRARARLHRSPVREDEPYGVDWIDGCAMLLRRQAVEAVGLLDERFFIYFEELDLCTRLRAAGWRIAVQPTAKVYQQKERVPTRYYSYYMNRNRFLYWNKHFGMGTPRVAVHVALDTLGLFRWWLVAVVSPSLWSERSARGKWLLGQLRWGGAGVVGHLRGRYGRAGSGSST